MFYGFSELLTLPVHILKQYWRIWAVPQPILPKRRREMNFTTSHSSFALAVTRWAQRGRLWAGSCAQICRSSSFKSSLGWQHVIPLDGWTDITFGLTYLHAGTFLKYDRSIVWQMHYSRFCVYLCQAGWSGGWWECVLSSESKRQKKELNQVQSCALPPGQRPAGRQPAGAYSRRMKHN